MMPLVHNLFILSSIVYALSLPSFAEVDAPLEYMGRKIATTMHWSGAAWLIRDSREREEASSLMMKQLHLKPGQTVCDLGCGNGYYTLELAKRVGATGQVLAVDIQQEMLSLLEERAKEQNIPGIKTILGGYTNPNLPKQSVDLVLLVDVYHEFSHPKEMLGHIKASLKPKGRVVLVEYRGEDPDVPIKPDHKMTRKQIIKEMAANEFILVEEFQGLPWQHLLFFQIKP